MYLRRVINYCRLVNSHLVVGITYAVCVLALCSSVFPCGSESYGRTVVGDMISLSINDQLAFSSPSRRTDKERAAVYCCYRSVLEGRHHDVGYPPAQLISVPSVSCRRVLRAVGPKYNSWMACRGRDQSRHGPATCRSVLVRWHRYQSRTPNLAGRPSWRCIRRDSDRSSN